MSSAAVRQVLLTIADDMLTLANLIMEDDSISNNTKVNRNTLKGSQLREDLAVAISQTRGEDPVIKTLFNHYVVYLEWDRPKGYGKQPPISALKDWAAKNGIPTDAETLWAISYAIWRDGHEGRPIFATMDKFLDELYDTEWADKLRAAILDNLDKIFND